MKNPRFWRRPLDLDRWRVAPGRVVVATERCKGCALCVDHCPTDVLVLSDEYNSRGYHFPIVAPGKEDDCVACGFCQSVCPDFAIHIETGADR